MTAYECESDEEDGGSIMLSSRANRLQNTSSARRKMWGEDGNGARRIKLR